MVKFGQEPNPQKLTLIPEAGKKGRKRLYRCECGVEKWIQPHSVNSGRAKSCGCSRKTGVGARKKRRSAIPMKGRQFGSLVVIGRSARPKGNKPATGAYWFVKCTCGRIKTVYGGSLRSGATTSCGECGK